ncbi:hypothetical protein GEV33_006173 [Tenebrio molitor]|uniref:Sushi domain-containing protein n=1 Tax=Tenebrio molitor TaxID=7067 RepID=A0A8J6HN57_TENMO|nr:hypothetical protein GEV33_006173 [Tenebrio molitor]
MSRLPFSFRSIGDDGKCENCTTIITPPSTITDETGSTLDPTEPTEPTKRPQGGCILPEHPDSGRWSVLGNSSQLLSAGKFVEKSTILRVQCNEKHKLDGHDLLVCRSGSWSGKVGKCLKTCSSIQNTVTTKVVCEFKGKEIDNCTDPEDGTIAKFKCAPFYEEKSLNLGPLLCVDGTWSRPAPKCVPAAYCVTDYDGKLLPKSEYTLAVGKYYRSFSDPRDAHQAQFSEVEDIFVPVQYKGISQNYSNSGDIAIMVSKKVFKFSLTVQPVCVDWTKILDNFLSSEKKEFGYISPVYHVVRYPSSYVTSFKELNRDPHLSSPGALPLAWGLAIHSVSCASLRYNVTSVALCVLAMGGKGKLLQRIAELEHRLDRHVPQSRSRDRSGSYHRRTRKRDSRTSASRTPSRNRSHSPSRHRRTAAGRKPRVVSTGRQRQHSYSEIRYLHGPSSADRRDVYSPSGLASPQHYLGPQTSASSLQGVEAPSETDDILSLHAVDDLPDNVLLLLGEPPQILVQGLASDELSRLTEKYKRPTNCEQLEPSEIKEMVAHMSGGNKNRDQTLCSSQKQLTTALSALGQAITRMLDITRQNCSTELKESMLQFLGDSGRLLTHLFYTLTTLRRSLIFPLVNKEIKAVLEKTVPTGYLFGADLPEKLKTPKLFKPPVPALKLPMHRPSKIRSQKREGGQLSREVDR